MLEGDQLIIRCREICDIARTTSEGLQPFMKSASAGERLYTFKDRVKDPTSIWMKVHRKRRDAQAKRILLEAKGEAVSEELLRQCQYEPEDITDAWGLRYVLLFNDQMEAVVNSVLGGLEERNQQSSLADGSSKNNAVYDRVGKTHLKEAIVYHTGSKKSTDSAEKILGVLKSSNKFSSVIVDQDSIKSPVVRQGYSSVHLVFETKVLVDFPKGSFPEAGRRTHTETSKFEVQIRDVFEEAWSESEHSLFYSTKDDFSEKLEEELNEIAMIQNLAATHRSAVDMVREGVATVKTTVAATRLKFAPKFAYSSTTSPESDLERLTLVLEKVAPQAIGALKDAYADLEKVDKQEGDKRQAYVDVAARFETLTKNLSKHLDVVVPETDGRTLGFFLKIELANASFFSRDDEHVRRSITLYQNLYEKFPQDPVVRLRLGRARFLHENGSVGLIQEVLKLIEPIGKLAAADPLTTSDHWLTTASLIFAGFLHHRLAELDNENAVDHYLRAAISAKRSVECWDLLTDAARSRGKDTSILGIKALSNWVYFVAKLIKLGHDGPEVDAPQLRKNLERLKTEDGAVEYADSYKSWDNMMRGWDALDESANARTYALKIYDRIGENVSRRAGAKLEYVEWRPYLTDEERMNLGGAISVIMGNGVT